MAVGSFALRFVACTQLFGRSCRLPSLSRRLVGVSNLCLSLIFVLLFCFGFEV